MSGGRDWTTVEARRAREMRAAKVRVKDIAAALGRTPDAVNSFLRYVPSAPGRPACTTRIGPRVDAWTEDDVRRLRELAALGVKSKEAAVILGRTAAAVQIRASAERIRFRGVAGGHEERETRRHAKDAALGSAMLRDAIRIATDAEVRRRIDSVSVRLLMGEGR